MSDEFDKDLRELKNIEKQIQNEIKSRREMKKEDSTYKIDQNIKKLLDNFQNKLSSANSCYVQKYTKSTKEFSEREATRRINLIQELQQSCNYSKNTYESLVNEKHKYNNYNKFDDYQETDDMKNLTNKELFQLQKDKINNQNEQIDNITNIATQGRKKAREIRDEADKQIKLLDKVEIDMEKTQQQMVKTRGKFMTYIEKSSNCCILTVIFVELALLFLVIFI